MKNNVILSERIAKRIAGSGICSRREAEKLILQKRVKVNGSIIKKPNLNVSSSDIILIDENPIPKKPTLRLWLFHKPKNCLVTNKDSRSRPTIFEKLPTNFPRVVSVGRLDFDTEGLILLTNNGEFSRELELPNNKWIRRYRARVYGYVDDKKLLQLNNGITIDKYNYGPIKASLDLQKNSNAWVTISLMEGKNREIRKIFDHLGYPINRLIRISYGPFHLGNLLPNEVSEVNYEILKDNFNNINSFL